MSVDDILADPVGALGLPEGAIPVSAIVLVEYLEPGSDNHPASKRLARATNEELEPWSAHGILSFAAESELRRYTGLESS